jgi:hypothetical protein
MSQVAACGQFFLYEVSDDVTIRLRFKPVSSLKEL